MKKIIRIPAAYIIAALVVLAMIALIIWQITLPKTDPVKIMVIFCLCGMIASAVIASHRIKKSNTPFQAASLPLGIMIIWVGLGIGGTCIYGAIKESFLPVAIAGAIVMVTFVLGGIKTIK